ncbi:hypothetical protein A4A49_64569, partial [Nicotiana attenuata]
YTNILANCRYLLDQLHSPIMAHTYREGNEVADGLAQAGCNMDSTDKPFIFEKPPDFVSTFSQRDQAGETRFRKTTCLLQEQLEDVDQNTFENHCNDLSTVASNGNTVMVNYDSIESSSIGNRHLSNNYSIDACASPSV